MSAMICRPRANFIGDGRGGDMDYPYNLGPYSRKVTNTSADAQRWFDRGLNWCFGYHHEEAVACFEKVLEADPNVSVRIAWSPPVAALANRGDNALVGGPRCTAAAYRPGGIRDGRWPRQRHGRSRAQPSSSWQQRHRRRGLVRRARHSHQHRVEVD